MEKTFMITKDHLQIPCRLSVPEDGEIRRLVLGVHGIIGSSMDRIQVDLAGEMDLFSAATLRFDFPAHGENPMGEEDFSLKNCMDTLLAAAQWLKETYPEVEDLCIFATGYGAYVTLLCIEELIELPGTVKLVIQTPSVVMHQTLLYMTNISRETLWAMDSACFEPAKRPLTVHYRFYEELEKNIALNSYPIPMLILHGEEDAYIKMEHIQQLRRLNERAKLVIIPGTSHQFLEEGAWDMVLDLTRDWFEFEQVLLTDWI